MLNLLDLPDEMLEEIFSYCLRSLEELKQCNSFIKGFIETHPRLKRPPLREIDIRIYPKEFNVDSQTYNKKYADEMEKTLQEYLSSDKIYDSFNIYYYNSDNEDDEEIGSEEGSDDDDESIPDTVQLVANKHAVYIENFSSRLGLFSMEYAIQSLNLMEHMRNLVTVELYLNTNAFYVECMNGSVRYEHDGTNYFFPKLKKLILHTDLDFPLILFGSCKTIEEFQFHSYEISKMTFNIFKILKNCKEALKKFALRLGHYKRGGDCSKYKATFLTKLANVGLNLEKFSFHIYNWSQLLGTDTEINTLCKFLTSNTNLTKFNIYSLVNEQFCYKFGETLPSFKSLKTLKLSLDGIRIETLEDPQDHGWKLSTVEKIDIDFTDFKTDIMAHIFHFPSDQLKEIVLRGQKLHGYVEKIAKNYPNLTRLELGSKLYSGTFVERDTYSSNDIFFILKYLKKLQYLTFEFPKDNLFDASGFNDLTDDLRLPYILQVEFKFNESMWINNEQLLKLMQLLSNMNHFTSDRWKNINDESFDIMTRELPNLSGLNIWQIYSDCVPTIEALLVMKSNIEKINANPAEFKFNYSTIDYHIEKANRKNQN